MSEPTVFDENDGYLDATFKTRDGGTTDVRLDLYETQAAVNDAVRANAEAGDGAVWRAWGAWLESQGVPPLSFAELYRLNATVNERVEEYKKKVSGSLNSPASPAPSTCPSTPEPSAS